MKAVGFEKSLPIDDARALVDLLLPEPTPGPHDLLVEVRAVAVNPVDTKLRRNAPPEPGTHRILGFDAAGVVRAVGPRVTRFRPGDRVWYAGSIERPGTNAELHAVDEHIVGHMPTTLDFEHAAALPLTALTAWELLFERLALSPDPSTHGRLLVVGAGGGVGSILVQLAARLTGLTIVATAGRPETERWARQLGAHEVISHVEPLSKGLERLGIAEVDYAVGLTHTEAHQHEIVKCLKPQGKFGFIDDPKSLDVLLFKRKSLSIHVEFMFTRSLFVTADRVKQHEILNEVARLVDVGTLRSTLTDVLGPIDAEHLRRAHALLESGTARGKIVLSGFSK